jgi:hypothetical protein
MLCNCRWAQLNTAKQAITTKQAHRFISHYICYFKKITTPCIKPILINLDHPQFFLKNIGDEKQQEIFTI